MIMRELSNECENYQMNMREFSNEFEIGVERILYNQMNIGFIANICKLSNKYLTIEFLLHFGNHNS